MCKSFIFMWLRSIWYILTLRCDEADRLRAIGDPAVLARHQRVAERIHRGLCKGCRRAAAQMERLDRGMRDLAGTVGETPHPEWNADRLSRLDAAFRHGTGRGSGPASGAAGPGARDPEK